MHGSDNAPEVLDLAGLADFAAGPLMIRPAIRQIEGPLGCQPVEPRVMQVIVVLSDADGRVVSREELFDRCWGAVFVGDDALNRVISSARRALRDAGLDEPAIETIPRSGYRWMLAAEGQDRADLLADAGQPAAVPPAPPRTFSRRTLLAGAGVSLVAGSGLWWAWHRRRPRNEVAALLTASDQTLRLGSDATDQQAIGYLEQAVALEPGNATAWGKLALALAQSYEHAPPPVETARIAHVEEAARRALQLDQSSGDAETAMALSRPYYGDWLAAETRLRRILARHPGQTAARDSLSFLLGAVGRMRESAEERLTVCQQEPHNANYQQRLIYALWFLGRIAESDQVAGRGLETWPQHAGIWFGHLWVLAGTGRIDKALALIDDMARRPPIPGPILATLKTAMAAAGSRRPADVQRVSGQLIGQAGRSIAAVINALMLLNLMGATDTAFDLANAYYLERGPLTVAVSWNPSQFSLRDQRRRKTNMLFVPSAATMRADPRFSGLVRDMGLDSYWRQGRVVPDFRQT